MHSQTTRIRIILRQQEKPNTFNQKQDMAALGHRKQSQFAVEANIGFPADCQHSWALQTTFRKQPDHSACLEQSRPVWPTSGQ